MSPYFKKPCYDAYEYNKIVTNNKLSKRMNYFCLLGSNRFKAVWYIIVWKLKDVIYSNEFSM